MDIHMYPGDRSSDPLGEDGVHAPRSQSAAWANRPSNAAAKIGGMLQNFTGNSTDIGRGAARLWNQVHASLGAFTAALGVVFILWSLYAMGGLNAQLKALLIGFAVVAIGIAGLLGGHKNMASMKTLHLVAVGCTVLLSMSFLSQIGRDAENDCIMAETWLRLDHLEQSMMSLKHDDLLNGIMVRLDHMHDSMEHVEHGAADMADHRREQLRFKERDNEYVASKLDNLIDMAEDSLAHADLQIIELSRNATAVSDAADTGGGELTQMQKTQMAARLKNLRARETYMKRQKAVLQELKQKMIYHAQQGLTPSDYEELIKVLERNTGSDEVAAAVREEKKEVSFVRASMERMHEDRYHEIVVGDYDSRRRNRVEEREKKRKEFEDHMQAVISGHENKFSNQEHYLKSLNDHLDELPEHCLREMTELKAGVFMVWAIIGTLGLGAHAGLTSIVHSVKKEY